MTNVVAAKKVTNAMVTELRREGFWHSDKEPTLPMPHPSEEPWLERGAFLAALSNKQQNSPSITKRRFRGYSTCRICGGANGNAEFSDNGWTWPAGLYHYVSSHAVRPSPAFVAFVMGKRAVAANQRDQIADWFIRERLKASVPVTRKHRPNALAKAYAFADDVQIVINNLKLAPNK